MSAAAAVLPYVWAFAQIDQELQEQQEPESILPEPRYRREFGNLAWPTSAVCFGPPLGTLMLRELGSAGA
jgi:hypothetical protein